MLKIARIDTVGGSVGGYAVIRSATLGDSRNGQYWTLVLGDNSGEIKAKIWPPLAQNVPDLKTGDVLYFEATVTEYKGVMELKITGGDVIVNPDNELLAELVRSAPNIEYMWEHLLSIAETQIEGALQALVLGMLNRYSEEFKTAPGAKGIHHAFRGGLLMHTLRMTSIALDIAGTVNGPSIDKSLLAAGCILHDIGKLVENEGTIAYERTDLGKLIGHIPLGAAMVRDFIVETSHNGLEDLAEFDDLFHIILSHHGRLEWGSPVQPKTLEAIIAHQADLAESRLQIAAEALEQAEPGAWAFTIEGEVQKTRTLP